MPAVNNRDWNALLPSREPVRFMPPEIDEIEIIDEPLDAVPADPVEHYDQQCKERMVLLGLVLVLLFSS